MKFRFETAGKPLGKGSQKETFVDPDSEDKVISVIKSDENGELKLAPREMKASYYLTKIAHMVLPKHIPDMHQAGKMGESAAFVRERAAHDPTHAALQEADTEADDEQTRKEIVAASGKDIKKLTDKLVNIGFAFDIDGDVSNFTKDEEGNLKYFEEFHPWESVVDGPELKFDKKDLEKAIRKIPDEHERATAERYLARVLELFEEEKAEYAAKKAALEAVDYTPEIEEVREAFKEFEATYDLDALRAITTVEEAVNSALRISAKQAFISLYKKSQELQNKPISDEVRTEFFERYKNIELAIGIIRNGKVEHSR